MEHTNKQLEAALVAAIRNNNGNSVGYGQSSCLWWDVWCGYPVGDLVACLTVESYSFPRWEFDEVGEGDLVARLTAESYGENTEETASKRDKKILALRAGLGRSMPVSYLTTKRDRKIFELAMQQAAEVWNTEAGKRTTWKRVVECMRREVEDDSFRLLSPAVAAEFGLPVPEKVLEVLWDFRGGKYLCLESFQGYSLEYTEDTLADKFPTELVPSLLAYIKECDKMLSPQSVKRSFGRWITSLAVQAVEDCWQDAEKALALKQLRKAAKRRLRLVDGVVVDHALVINQLRKAIKRAVKVFSATQPQNTR